MERELKIGQHVVFIDQDREERDALVIAIHGDPKGRLTMYKDSKDPTKGFEMILPEEGPNWPCVNLTTVVKDPAAQDQYGRQTVKDGITSVVHHSHNSAGGFCWRFADEELPDKPRITVS
jgi:hypothetical protein